MVWYSASAGQTVNELGSDSEKGLSDAQARKLIEYNQHLRGAKLGSPFIPC